MLFIALCAGLYMPKAQKIERRANAGFQTKTTQCSKIYSAILYDSPFKKTSGILYPFQRVIISVPEDQAIRKKLYFVSTGRIITDYIIIIKSDSPI